MLAPGASADVTPKKRLVFFFVNVCVCFATGISAVSQDPDDDDKKLMAVYEDFIIGNRKRVAGRKRQHSLYVRRWRAHAVEHHRTLYAAWRTGASCKCMSAPTPFAEVVLFCVPLPLVCLSVCETNNPM